MLQTALLDRKIGLALSGGSARGLAHIGVLSVLKEQGIHIDMISGTSIGSLIGALYAGGKDIEQLRSLAMNLGPKRFSFLADPGLPKSGLIRGRKIKNMLRATIGDIEFSDLEIPFACAATDIRNGQEVVIRQGLVREGVRASCSIPLLMAPTKLGDRYLVDGGLCDPVPVRILKEMGADFIIAVNVSPGMQGRYLDADNEHAKKNGPNILDISIQLVNIISNASLNPSLLGADVIIEPKLAHIGWGDFHRVQECILQGELAAADSMQEIKRQLEQVSCSVTSSKHNRKNRMGYD